MNATDDRSMLGVNRERLADFVENRIEVTSLVAFIGGDRIAVHRIDRPEDRMA